MISQEKMIGTKPKLTAVIFSIPLTVLILVFAIFCIRYNDDAQEYAALESQIENELSGKLDTLPQTQSVYQEPLSLETEEDNSDAANFPNDIRMSHGTLYTLVEADENAVITRYDYDGTTLDSVTVPLIPEHYSDNNTRTFEDIQHIVFDEELVYFQRGKHTENLVAAESSWQHSLECWNMETAQMCWFVDITNDLFLHDYECGLDDLYLTGDNLLAATSEEVYVMNKQGGYVNHITRGIPRGSELCQDRDGNVYWSHVSFQGDVEKLDLEQMISGDFLPLISQDELSETAWCRVIPGNESFDFFILREKDLLGVSFSGGIKCLTTWEACGITLDPVEGVYLGEGQFLLLLRDAETWERSVTQITISAEY